MGAPQLLEENMAKEKIIRLVLMLAFYIIKLIDEVLRRRRK
jgi:hypothetical protein